MEDPKGKAVEVSGDAGLIQTDQLSVSFETESKKMEGSSAANASSGARSRAAKIPTPPPPPPPPPAREVNPLDLELLFEKRLTYSDLKGDGRIIIPKDDAETHLPELNDKEGFYMFLDDVASIKVWMFKYRFWSNLKHRKIYVFEKTGDFTKAHGLQTGDFLMIYKDNTSERLVVGSRNAIDQQNIELPNNDEDDGMDNPNLVPVDETNMELFDLQDLMDDDDFLMEFFDDPIIDLSDL